MKPTPKKPYTKPGPKKLYMKPALTKHKVLRDITAGFVKSGPG